MSRRALAGLLVLVACALVLGACGGSGEPSKAEYGTQLNAAMDELEEAYGDAGAAAAKPGTGTTPADVERTVAQLRTSQIALRDAGNQLAEIDAPKDLAQQHEQLVHGVRDMADAIDLLIEAQQLAATNPKRAQALAKQFAEDPAFQDVVAASTKIREAGVDAGL